MTCEALCMNRYGLTIAVDGAVSLGHNGRSYPSADKLFPLGGGAPVAIAIYGSAHFLRVPWKLILESFIAHLGDRRFPTLDGYQQAFIAFCESDHPLFTVQQEAADFKDKVSGFWRHHLHPLFQRHGQDTREWAPEAWEALRIVLRDEIGRWSYGVLPGFPESFGAEVLEAFAPQVEELLEHWFDSQLPPDDIWQALRETIDRHFTQDWIWPSTSSGIVFLGFGEEEYFPRYSELTVGSRILGRLRYRQGNQGAVHLDRTSAVVQVFAQPDMVDAFILGIPRRMAYPMSGYIEEATRDALRAASLDEEEIDAIDLGAIATEKTDAFFGMLHDEFRAPLMDTVAALPTRELAGLCRTLVSVAAFRSHFSSDDSGSVGGEIRVAAITKHGGVEWVG